MAKSFISIVIAGILALGANASLSQGEKATAQRTSLDGIQRIKPASVEIMPDITMEEYNRMSKLADQGKIDEDSFYSMPVFSSLYFEGCSWYCGGWVDTITDSGHLAPQGDFTYDAQNAHDFDHESVWATNGNGVGQYLTFTFAGNCPRITSVAILNGHVKTDQAWRNNSRVKSLLLYYNDKPYKLLELEDTRSLQHFDVDTLGYGPNVENASKWTLKFEILEVYPGKKYNDCVIADFIFDGIDVH